MLNAVGLIAGMKANQWKSREELERIQEGKLSRLLEHARRRVPHYRNYPSGGLEGLPFTGKDQIKNSPESFISRGAKGLESFPTSGSSGLPLSVYYDSHEGMYGFCLSYFQMSEAGFRPWRKMITLSSSPMKRGPLHRIVFPRAAHLSVFEDEHAMLEKLKAGRPHILRSFPSILTLLSRINDGLHIPSVFSSSEVLSKEARRLIKKSFGCDLRDFYGTNETSWIAWECEKGSMHVHSDSIIVEIVDGKGNRLREGRTGDIALTPLWRHSMPFIRYLIGDRGSLGRNCACGRGTHVLRTLEGRADDMVVLPSGRLRSARSINLMDDMGQVTAYQIIQEKPDLFVFRHVPAGDRLDTATKKEVESRIRRGCLGEGITVEFEQVGSIGRGSTGKINTVISKVRK